MSSIRKIQSAAETAGQRYRDAVIDAQLAHIAESPDAARLSRRAGAYRIQMEAAERRADEALERAL